MTFISYAQNFEDVLLNRVFKDKTKGFYLDVGAFHPTVDSVTKSFYNLGWSGINIEPIKECYNLFKQERSRDINLNIALSNLEGTIEFFQVVEQPGNSTLDKEIADKIAQQKGLKLSRYTVPVKTLAEVCKEYVDQKIDFLKIDVEGLEEEVVLGGNWERFRPTILVIETTFPGTNVRCENNIPVFLMGKGYQQVFFDGINDYYISEESGYLAKYFSFPINILDDYINYRLIEKHRSEQIIQVGSRDKIDAQPARLITPNPEKTTTIHESSNEQDYSLRNILIDAVFFQINNTGIARVWKSLLEEWVNSGFANHIIVLDRTGTAPKIPGIKYQSLIHI